MDYPFCLQVPYLIDLSLLGIIAPARGVIEEGHINDEILMDRSVKLSVENLQLFKNIEEG